MSKPEKLTVEIPILPSSEPDRTPTPSISKNSKSKNIEEIDLNILLKFIKPYDGSRETINSFITNCNNAYELATESQKFILFKYILSQLQGKAEIAASIKDFTNYEQLKEFLKVQFSQRKHYAHLITDLQEVKQQSTETVTQFSMKIETVLAQLLTEISMNPTKKMEVPGRIAAMEDLALHHFLMGLHPRLSNIVRCKSPKSLNEAISFAVSEEKIQQTLYRRGDNASKPTQMGKPSQPKVYAPNNNFHRNNNPNFQRNFNNIQRYPTFKNYHGGLNPQQSSYPPRFQGQGQHMNRSYPARPQFGNNQNHPPGNNFNRPRINFVEEEEEGAYYEEEEPYPPVEEIPLEYENAEQEEQEPDHLNG